MTSITCIFCGCVFAMPDDMQAHLRKTGATFYCPSGHGQVYNKQPSEADKLRVQLDSMTRSRNGWQARCERAEARYQCVFAGCDHSNQTKAALRKHMEREHEFAQKPTKALAANAGPDAHGRGV